MQDPESDYVFVQTSTRGFTKVSKERYSLISGMILSILEQKSPLTIIELIEEMGEQVKNFNGNLPWYILRIKADLEARKIIRCRTGIGPVRTQFIQKCKISKYRSF